MYGVNNGNNGGDYNWQDHHSSSRPSWDSRWSNTRLPAGQERNHRLGFSDMNQELGSLNRGEMDPRDFVAAYKHVVPQDSASQQYLEDFANYPNKDQRMNDEFIRWMNSSTQNVRPGDASLNHSIGASFDGNFIASANSPGRRSPSPVTAGILEDRYSVDFHTGFRTDPTQPDHLLSSTSGSVPYQDLEHSMNRRVQGSYDGVDYGTRRYYDIAPAYEIETAYWSGGSPHAVVSDDAGSPEASPPGSPERGDATPEHDPSYVPPYNGAPAGYPGDGVTPMGHRGSW
jgi:hypothetical protein